jgi:outer membrane protein assembly factor BamA
MKFYILVIFLPYFSQVSFSQIFENEPNDQAIYIIDSIKIEGNDITEEFIILRELTFGIGDTVSRHILDYNEERIFSLGIFNNVELKTFSEDDRNILDIVVEESWYIYPVPFVQLKDKDWDKLSYGLYVLVKNFRGRNETLTGSLAFGYDPTLKLSYYKPSIIYRSNVFFDADFFYSRVTNKSKTAKELYGDNFEYTYIINEVGLGYRFGTFHRLGMSIGFNYVESPEYFRGVTASDSRIDRLLGISLGYSYDTRDLIQFPKEGMFFSFNMQLKGLGTDNVDYRIFKIDFRGYRKLITDLSGKLRLVTRQTAGKLIPFYDYSFLGFEEAVRGHFRTEREGNNYYIGSVELNHPIIRDINISLDFIPLLPRELVTFRLALYAQMFADMGTTQYRGDPIELKDFDKGYGIGLSLLLLPYNVVRFDLAFDENRNTEFIFDLAVSF